MNARSFTLPAAILLAALISGFHLGAADKPAANGTNSAPARLTNLFEDPVLARAKNLEIKRSQLEDAFTSFRANLAARGQELPEEQRTVREAQLLDRLIITQLLINHAVDADKARSKELAERFIAESKKSATSAETFNRQLKAMGMTFEQFNKRVEEQALSEAVIERELKSKLAVTDAQVEEFYKNGTDSMVKIMQEELERLAKNPDTSLAQLTAVKKQIQDLRKANTARLEQPERVRVIHLLISTRVKDSDEPLPDEAKKAKRQQIEKLLARAKAGEDFPKLVKEFSEDRGLQESGGEYSLSRDDPFVAEFKSAAFSLSTNQISDIVTTVFGYHIIKLLEKIPAKKVEFAKVSDDIKDALLQQELQQKMPEHFDKLKKEAGLQILDERYKFGPKEPRKSAQ